jgi:uncharacterized membrane protein
MKRRVVYGLLALSVVPTLGGLARLASIASADGAPMDARFALHPLPLITHILAASVFGVLGAFQFESDLRRAWPRWHRHAGRIVVLGGLLTAGTGIWMTLYYAIPPQLQGGVLFWVRLAVGGGMALSLVMAVRVILDGNVALHQAWMLRSYAFGQGAGTQVLFLLPPQLLLGEAVTGALRDILMTAAWAFNLLVAEFLIQRTRSSPADHSPASQRRHLAPLLGVSSQRTRPVRPAAPEFPHAAGPAVFESTP